LNPAREGSLASGHETTNSFESSFDLTADQGTLFEAQKKQKISSPWSLQILRRRHDRAASAEEQNAFKKHTVPVNLRLRVY